MAAPYIKSVVYLGVFGSLGYVLMSLVEPSEEKKKQIRETGYADPSVNEARSKKAQFLEKLKEATTDTPIYLKKKEPAAETPRQPSKREIN